MPQANRLTLTARILSKEQLRYTPAGIAVLSFQVEHRSFQREAGQSREVLLALDCIVIGDQAKELERVSSGSDVRLTGFLANRSSKSRWVVLHVNEFQLKLSGENQ